MDIKYIPLLKQLGLDERSSKLYLAALEYGPASIAKLAQKSGIKRTTIYHFVNDLVEKGLIAKSVSGKRTLYSATNPENLSSVVEKQKEAVRQIMPDFLSIFKKNPKRPKITFYEGIEGYKTAFNDSLDQPEGSYLRYYSPYEKTYEFLPKTFIYKYVAKRVKKNIHSRAIVPADKEVEETIKDDKKEKRETIILPKGEFQIPAMIMIYNNKVSYFSLGEEKLAVIIESKEIFETEKMVFDLLWDKYKK